MKFKAQVKILEDRDIHYTTEYLEIDQELMTEIKNIAQQRHNNCYQHDGNELQKGERKIKIKNHRQKVHGEK